MTIGIIGAGMIGGTLTRRLTELGHEVRVANSRAPETLEELAEETSATPVWAEEVPEGADLIIVECVPAPLARHLSAQLSVPVVGIGAGAGCDGQILVLHDALGVSAQPPRFARDFSDGAGSVQQALAAYVDAVRTGTFPGPEHEFEA